MIKIELYEFIECSAEDLKGYYLFVRGEPKTVQTWQERELLKDFFRLAEIMRHRKDSIGRYAPWGAAQFRQGNSYVRLCLDLQSGPTGFTFYATERADLIDHKGPSAISKMQLVNLARDMQKSAPELCCIAAIQGQLGERRSTEPVVMSVPHRPAADSPSMVSCANVISLAACRR